MTDLCIPNCKNTETDKIETIRCGICARYFHHTCVEYNKDDQAPGIWSCPTCRQIPHMLTNLQASIDKLTQMYTTLDRRLEEMDARVVRLETEQLTSAATVAEIKSVVDDISEKMKNAKLSGSQKADTQLSPEGKALNSVRSLMKNMTSDPRCWTDDWVRKVSIAAKEYEKNASQLKVTKEFTPFQEVAYHYLSPAKTASPSQQENFLQVCQMLCNDQFRTYIRDVPIIQIVYNLCHDPQKGERCDIYVKIFGMAMAAFLHNYDSMDYDSKDFKQMKPDHKFLFLCRFPEVVVSLEDAVFYMLKHKINASCVLEWWTKTFITMKTVIFGDLLSRFTLELFLSDLRMLRRVDFDLETLKKAFDSVFPGSFRKTDKKTLFAMRMQLKQENTIQYNRPAFHPGSFVEQGDLKNSGFSRYKKAEIGRMVMALLESPDVKSMKQGSVNYDVKKFLIKFTAPEAWKHFESAEVKWSIQDMVDSLVVDEKSLNLIWYIQNTLDREGVKSKKRAFMTIVDLAAECTRDEKVDEPSEKTYKAIREELEKLELELSSNWMGRNSMHLLALVCYKEEVYSALERACPNLVKSLMGHRDIHGTTPYLLACACKNDIAREFFVRQGATLSETDFFGNTNEQLLQQSYLFCVEKETKRPSIPLSEIDFSLYDREVCIQYVTLLFDMMIKEMVNSYPILEATIEIVGSVREQTKVAQMDEFDIQILFKTLSARVKSYTDDVKTIIRPTFGRVNDNSGLISEQGRLDMTGLIDVIKESMQKTLTKMDHSVIPLRIVNLDDPWLMIYEGNGKSKGMWISFDIVPVIEIPDAIVEGDILERIISRQSRILKEPVKNPLRVFLKRSKLDELTFRTTCASSERNIIDCLPVEARLGVVMVKSLLRQQCDCAITSYMVKTALFYALDKKISNGEISKLGRPEKVDRWITNSAAKEFYNEGRHWAIHILTSIKTIKCSFLEQQQTVDIAEVSACVDDIIKAIKST